MPAVTAVLSGGGVKATAHLGVLRALGEAGLAPSRYVGTSMGAVVAAALAAGLSPEEVLARAGTVRRRDVARLSGPALMRGLFAVALLQPEPLQRTIARLVPAEEFSELNTPLTVTAADLDTGELVCFGAGGESAPLLSVLYASCALPMWYPPAQVNGRRLADGGLRGVVPLAAATRFNSDVVVAVDAGPGFDAAPATGRMAAPPLLRIHTDATNVLMSANSELELALWRASPDRPPLLYIRPQVERGATFAVSNLLKYEEAGYLAARRALQAWAGSPGAFPAEVGRVSSGQ
jgi:NTE family protein